MEINLIPLINLYIQMYTAHLGVIHVKLGFLHSSSEFLYSKLPFLLLYSLH